MANLRMPKTEDELKHLTVANTKKAYVTLAEDYEKIIDNKICYCPRCGNWLASSNFYRNDKNADNLEHWGCKKDIVLGGCDYNKNTDTLTDNKTKAKYMCRVLDWVFIEKIYDDQVQASIDALGEKNRSTGWQQYIVMIQSLPNWKGKTWTDSEFLNSDDSVDSNRKPREEIVKLFGRGFTNEDYLYLQDQYDEWKERTQVDSKSQETYIVRICFKLLDIWKAQRSGRDTEKLDKSLNDLMASANLQPRQNVSNASTDSLTFGQMIEKWEMERPIPEPLDEFKDPDGIGKFLRVWFKGALMRALGLDGGYAQEYDDYIEKYSVQKPTSIDDEDSIEDDEIDKIFGKNE